ncbi:F-box domain containing protein [Parasponia andersonii]|uniref:F-box domain containing protein n=1 Tax=Parasponia andersonii TaxID=3476 RepID=A0A2P5DDZ7_PARAD|nr:F-box domain containing protein [Parasponia andersonii]
MASHLPPEMIKEILCRLGVKDLLRYRSVCKEWCSIIDGPDFITTHLKHSKLGLLINGFGSLETPDQLVWVELDGLEREDSLVRFNQLFEERASVLGGCNGLLVVEVDAVKAMAIWNPSTRKYRVLSYNSNSSYRSWVMGFGYDPIYSMKAKTWRRLDDDFHENYGYNEFDDHVLVNNALHWILTPKLEGHGPFAFIFEFDLVTEQHREISMPNFELVEGEMFTYKLDRGSSVVWARLFSVLPSEIIGSVYHPLQSVEYLVPLAYHKTTDKVLLCINYQRLVVYHLQIKTAKDVRISDIPNHFEPFLCVNSLVGVD